MPILCAGLSSSGPRRSPSMRAGIALITALLGSAAAAGAHAPAGHQPGGFHAAATPRTAVIPAGPIDPMAPSLRSEAAQAGTYLCEGGEQLRIGNLAPDLGSLIVRFRGRSTLLFAVDTDSGAVRYEDRRSGLTWIRIPSKSMLLDSRLGEALANDCVL